MTEDLMVIMEMAEATMVMEMVEEMEMGTGMEEDSRNPNDKFNKWSPMAAIYIKFLNCFHCLSRVTQSF